jgi:multiple sugar transport system substrate-binding protein
MGHGDVKRPTRRQVLADGACGAPAMQAPAPARHHRRPVLVGGTLATAAAGWSLAGCGALPAAEPGPPTSAVAPATIRFTYWGANTEEISIQDRVIAAFNQKHPQIKVENGGDSAGTGDYHNKLVAQAAAGTWSDVGRIQSVDMPRFARGGLLLPLDDLVRRDRYSLDDFWPAVLPMTQFQQKRYTLPVIGGPNPLFWSPKLFREAGLAPATEQDAKGAWTWDAFVQAARRLTKQEGDVFRTGGYSLDLTWGGLGPFIWSAGGDYYNAALSKCVIAEPGAIEGVQFMVDLIQKHRVWPAPSQGTTGLQWFPGTTIAMQIGAITGSWQWRQDASFEFDVVMNPKGRRGRWAGSTPTAMASSPAPPRRPRPGPSSSTWPARRRCRCSPRWVAASPGAAPSRSPRSTARASPSRAWTWC